MYGLLVSALALLAAVPSDAPAAADAAPIDGRFEVGGRSIRLSCTGVGSPTVVIDAGLGTAPVEDPGWGGIAEKVAPVTRICRYDRAGLGGSDPAPAAPRTSADAAADLHAALAKAKVPGPYLLAGHSIGGLHTLVFAARYPGETAGLVLISSTHPDQMTRWLSLLPPAAVGEEKAVTEARSFLTMMIADPTKNEEKLNFTASAAQARELKTLGARPVIVATHSPRFRMVPGLSEPLAIKLEAATQQMQKQFLSLSSNARQNIAATAGHGLPHEAPDFVVDNILQAVALARRKAD
ncbi:alpha/beta hydrolase [Sphingomonas sp. DG1-23]|uniref:alpha/beta fold hydrolase n=1 Tax=Sphingomonas sp. DG1-23 TaxID=3068316 RepID=UPI00273FAD9D|nr:alpha/beta hydrolase [Sphingomonas sp. DG1-23]MDP5280421.1 alpha/beta hydrolase [Sphingomonas sp. DG1-23]